MAAHSKKLESRWRSEESGQGQVVKKSRRMFTVDNKQIDAELAELESARGPRRMELLLMVSKRLYSMRLMMEDELKNTEWWEKMQPHPGLREFLEKHLAHAHDLGDLTRGFMSPGRGRPRGTNAYRNSILIGRMMELMKPDMSVAECSRLVSDEMSQGTLEPLRGEILEPKTIANLWTAHLKSLPPDE